MLKLAILSDIHGNSIALQAVLRDLDARGDTSHIIVLGDLAVFGPDPGGVLNLLQAREPVSYVRGQTDRCLVEAHCLSNLTNWGGKSQLSASFSWTAKQLSQAGLQFLAGLPSQQILRFSESHVVLAVHGSPRSDEEYIHPHTSDIELNSMLGDLSYNLLLCAHTHIPFDRVVAGRRIVNVGSVGLPFDGDRRASYALVYLRPGGEYQVEFRRVAYNVEAVVQQLLAIDHPAASISAPSLRAAQPLNQGLIYAGQRQRRLRSTTRWQYQNAVFGFTQTSNAYASP